ncbi:MAG: ATP synthase F1 subunit delta [SAR202 cluster bacterium]|nr:ATP synthase F1 subunit delta [SAR202 cluster bacterium]
MAKKPSARRYAEAAFELALEEKALDGWADDLATIARGLESEDLVNLLDAPNVPLAQKRKVLETVFAKSVKPLPLNLVSLLASRNSARLIAGVLDEYEKMLYAHKGIVLGELVSAVALDDQQTKGIAQRLKDIVGTEVKLSTRTDPAVLGGFVAKVGDKILDASTRTKLDQLRHTLVGRG